MFAWTQEVPGGTHPSHRGSELAEGGEQLALGPGGELLLLGAADLHQGDLGETGFDEGLDLLHVLGKAEPAELLGARLIAASRSSS